MKTIHCLFALCLAGCATQEQLQERQRAYMNTLYAQCSAYGFAQGTPDFGRCLMQLDMANRQSGRAANQQLIDSGLNTMRQNQPRPAYPDQIHCVPDRLGGTICR